MRNAQNKHTAEAMVQTGLLLGIACPVCRHRALFDPHLISDARPVWRLPFKCSGCGERKVFTYVLDENEIQDFQQGAHPRATQGHHQAGSS